MFTEQTFSLQCAIQNISYYGKMDILTVTELNIGEYCDLGGKFVLPEFNKVTMA